MNILYFELLKLRKKSRGWLGPILVFILIMTAFPLTVEFLNKDLEQAFFSILWIAVLLVMMLATTIFAARPSPTAVITIKVSGTLNVVGSIARYP